jgi:hypothetical protein
MHSCETVQQKQTLSQENVVDVDHPVSFQVACGRCTLDKRHPSNPIVRPIPLCMHRHTSLASLQLIPSLCRSEWLDPNRQGFFCCEAGNIAGFARCYTPSYGLAHLVLRILTSILRRAVGFSAVGLSAADLR